MSVDAVQKIVQRHRAELESDGLHKIGRKELKALPSVVADRLSITENTPSLVAWTPRAALRLGYLLRDSEVARQVRTVSLDLIEKVIPQQNDRIRELELQLELRRLDSDMLTMHGKEVVLALRGQSDQLVEVEKPVIEVIDETTGAKYKGQTTKQVAEYLNKKLGLKLHSGADVVRRLKAAEKDGLIGSIPRKIQQDYIPEENLSEVYKLLQSDGRQTVIGE